LIDDQHNARICDFGLVKVLASRSTGWTTTTTHMGTLRYLAYELVNAEGHVTVTTEGDMYALACLALEVSQTTHRVKYATFPARLNIMI
jgi:serine/threonine protein kinase